MFNSPFNVLILRIISIFFLLPFLFTCTFGYMFTTHLTIRKTSNLLFPSASLRKGQLQRISSESRANIWSNNRFEINANKALRFMFGNYEKILNNVISNSMPFTFIMWCTSKLGNQNLKLNWSLQFKRISQCFYNLAKKKIILNIVYNLLYTSQYLLSGKLFVYVPFLRKSLKVFFNKHII